VGGYAGDFGGEVELGGKMGAGILRSWMLMYTLLIDQRLN